MAVSVHGRHSGAQRTFNRAQATHGQGRAGFPGQPRLHAYRPRQRPHARPGQGRLLRHAHAHQSARPGLHARGQHDCHLSPGTPASSRRSKRPYDLRSGLQPAVRWQDHPRARPAHDRGAPPRSRASISTRSSKSTAPPCATFAATATTPSRKLAKEKKICEDEEKRALEEMQKMTDEEIRRMEEMSKRKEAEVMHI